MVSSGCGGVVSSPRAGDETGFVEAAGVDGGSHGGHRERRDGHRGLPDGGCGPFGVGARSGDLPAEGVEAQMRRDAETELLGGGGEARVWEVGGQADECRVARVSEGIRERQGRH